VPAAGQARWRRSETSGNNGHIKKQSTMKTSDFDYQIPKNLIAQFPSETRDDCRLLSINRSRHSIEHRRFNDLTDILKAGDRLIFNDTKVLPARLRCRKGTGAAVELLFTECIDKRYEKQERDNDNFTHFSSLLYVIWSCIEDSISSYSPFVNRLFYFFELRNEFITFELL